MSENQPKKFDEVINEYQRRDPFSPFQIVMASGDRYRIDDPFTMVISPADVFCSESKTGVIAKLRKSQIVAVEQLLSKPPA